MAIDTEDFREAWSTWLTYRKQIKKPLAETSLTAQLKEFADWGAERSIAAIRHTIRQGWQGIREPEQNGNGRAADDPRGTKSAIQGYLAIKERDQ